MPFSVRLHSRTEHLPLRNGPLLFQQFLHRLQGKRTLEHPLAEMRLQGRIQQNRGELPEMRQLLLERKGMPVLVGV